MIINRDLLRDDRITLLDEPSKTWSGFFENAKNFSRFMDQRFSFVEIDSISLFPFLATLLVQADGAEKDSLILGEHFFVDVDSLDRFLRGNLAIFSQRKKKLLFWKIVFIKKKMSLFVQMPWIFCPFHS